MNHLNVYRADGHVRRGIRHCSLCGNICRSMAFKGGYICQDCIDQIKAGSTSS